MLPKGTKEAANIALSEQRDYVAQMQKTCSLSHLATPQFIPGLLMLDLQTV